MKTKMKDNPFNLYDVPETIEYSRKATSEFKMCWDKFVQNWEKIQMKYRMAGACDTAARDTQAEWIKKHASDVW